MTDQLTETRQVDQANPLAKRARAQRDAESTRWLTCSYGHSIELADAGVPMACEPCRRIVVDECHAIGRRYIWPTRRRRNRSVA